MKRYLPLKLVITFLFLSIWLVTYSIAEISQPLGMVTGSSSGTYIQFGKEIADLAGNEGIEIIVKKSGGSLDNILRIKSTENAALGIVQSDVLGFIHKRSEDPELRQFVKHLRLLFPLYNEEVHLYANKKIKRFEDLQGKRVAIGTINSGNYVTSHNLFHTMKIEPREYVTNLKPLDAVAGVIAGQVDAMIYVAGKPVSVFTDLEKLKSDADVAPYFDKTHFVPLDQPEILREYVASEISYLDYKWFDNKIPTVAVKAVLIGYDFSEGQSPYYKMRCRQIAKLCKIIRDNIDWLKQTGHMKWREVNLDQKIGIWKLNLCSKVPISMKTDSTEDPENILHEKIKAIIRSPNAKSSLEIVLKNQVIKH